MVIGAFSTLDASPSPPRPPPKRRLFLKSSRPPSIANPRALGGRLFITPLPALRNQPRPRPARTCFRGCVGEGVWGRVGQVVGGSRGENVFCPPNKVAWRSQRRVRAKDEPSLRLSSAPPSRLPQSKRLMASCTPAKDTDVCTQACTCATSTPPNTNPDVPFPFTGRCVGSPDVHMAGSLLIVITGRHAAQKMTLASHLCRLRPGPPVQF